jgi:hypothetical protein
MAAQRFGRRVKRDLDLVGGNGHRPINLRSYAWFVSADRHARRRRGKNQGQDTDQYDKIEGTSL